jgi:hypothetical protein
MSKNGVEYNPHKRATLNRLCHTTMDIIMTRDYWIWLENIGKMMEFELSSSNLRELEISKVTLF